MKTRFTPISVLACAAAATVGFTALRAAPAQVRGPQSNNGIPVGIIGETSALPFDLPFTLTNGMLVVKAAVADGTPHDAVIATALPVAVITPALASRQHMTAEGVRDIPTLYGTVRGSNLKPQVVHLDRLSIGNVTFGAFDLFAYLSTQKAENSPPIWLGGPVLSSAVVTIDPDYQRIHFRAPNAPVPKKAVVIPFELKDGQIVVEVKVNGSKSFPMIVDTASEGSLLPSDVARSLKIEPLATMKATHPDGKECTVGALGLTELALGGAKLKDVQALYVSSGDASGLHTGPGILGLDVLLRFRVTIHYGLRRIYLENRLSLAEAAIVSAARTTRRPGASAPVPSRPGAVGVPVPGAPTAPVPGASSAPRRYPRIPGGRPGG